MIRLADKREEWERRGKLSFRNKMAATIALRSSCKAVRRLIKRNMWRIQKYFMFLHF
ncbi:hypothetical protein Chor_003448 [Crotalus horridus]